MSLSTRIIGAFASGTGHARAGWWRCTHCARPYVCVLNMRVNVSQRENRDGLRAKNLTLRQHARPALLVY